MNKLDEMTLGLHDRKILSSLKTIQKYHGELELSNETKKLIQEVAEKISEFEDAHL